MLSRRPSANPPDRSHWWMAHYRPEEILKKSIQRQPLPKKRTLGTSFLAWSAGMPPNATALERRAKLDWEVTSHQGWYYWKYHERKPRYVWIAKGPATSADGDANGGEEGDEEEEEDDGDGSTCCSSCCSNWTTPPAGIEWAQHGAPEMQAQNDITWSFPPMEEVPTRGRRARRRLESPVRADWSNQFVARNGRDGLPAIYSNVPPKRV